MNEKTIVTLAVTVLFLIVLLVCLFLVGDRAFGQQADAGEAQRYYARWDRAWDAAWNRYCDMQFALHPKVKQLTGPMAWEPVSDAPAEVWVECGKHARKLALCYRAKCRALLWRMEHPRGSGAARWLPLLRWAGWPKGQLPTCVRVIWRESNGIPSVTTGRYCGLFQLDAAFGRGVKDIFRPLTNVRLALQLYCRRGWQPWRATAF